MASKVQIANMALSELGADSISSFSDNTVSAKEVNLKYDIVAEIVMSMGAWPSVKRRATLAQLSTAPNHEFLYAYQLPTNPKCLRVLEINECRLGDVIYQIEDNKLLTNETSAKILYLAKIDDSEQYDVYLMQAIIAKLTATMAYKFTGQAAVAEALAKDMDRKMKKLLSAACAQGGNKRIPSDDYIDARR